jgi:hypothetical protein
VSAVHDRAREPVLLISPHPVDVALASLSLLNTLSLSAP